MASGISLGKAIAEFLASPQSRVGMRTELTGLSRTIGTDCPLFLLDDNDVKKFVMTAKKTAERQKRVDALVVFFDFAKENGWVHSNPAFGLVKKAAPKAKKTEPAVKPKASPSRAGQVMLSADGHKQIEAEIAELHVDKARVTAEVAAAREEGDLSENAGYHDARERLGLINGRIREKEDILARAVTED